MSSEEELEGLERAVNSAMFWHLLRRIGGTLIVALLLMAIELGVMIGALIGALVLPAPWRWGALAVYVAVLAVRVWRVRMNRKRRPAKPSRLWSVLLKATSLPMNALLVPAFVEAMPMLAAVIVVSLLTVVEIVVWWYIVGPAGRELSSIRDLADGGEPRTWEV